MKDYIVICILHGQVEEHTLDDRDAALCLALQQVARGGHCVEVYDAQDALVWPNLPDYSV